jgi:GMP synthase (glutamine-hydrolysing)
VVVVKRVIAIRHIAFEDLGSFEAVLRARDYEPYYVEASTADLPALPVTAPEPLFILGGPIGAYEEALYPFLNAELAFIEKRLAAKAPIVGICLGAQLMARALGARVYPAKAKELGWTPISLTEAGKHSVLRPLGNGPVLHWHGDTFDLPNGATRLASTDICENQAYSYGTNALALQFHIEAEPLGLERWYVGHTMELGIANISIPELRRTSKEVGPAAALRGNACLNAWLDTL